MSGRRAGSRHHELDRRTVISSGGRTAFRPEDPGHRGDRLVTPALIPISRSSVGPAVTIASTVRAARSRTTRATATTAQRFPRWAVVLFAPPYALPCVEHHDLPFLHMSTRS